MPTGMHRSGKPTPEVILTVLHAGGKFGQGGYKTSGGLHGVGASVVNALSEWLTVTIERDGMKYQQRSPMAVSRKQRSRRSGQRKRPEQKSISSPIRRSSAHTTYNYETLCERLRESAFLLKGLKIEIIDERHDQKEVFLYESGIQAFVEYLNEEKDNPS